MGSYPGCWKPEGAASLGRRHDFERKPTWEVRMPDPMSGERNRGQGGH